MKQQKSRRVFVTLELETNRPLSALRSPKAWSAVLALAGVDPGIVVMQAQANVAKAVGARKKA
jgi:hypothetical protein